MQGIWSGNTFESVDGHRYYKHGTDVRKSKVYLRCRIYSKGCPVFVHVRSLEQKDECDLKVIYKSGKHNHGGGKQERYSSESGLGPWEKKKVCEGCK